MKFASLRKPLCPLLYEILYTLIIYVTTLILIIIIKQDRTYILEIINFKVNGNQNLCLIKQNTLIKELFKTNQSEDVVAI